MDRLFFSFLLVCRTHGLRGLMKLQNKGGFFFKQGRKGKKKNSVKVMRVITWSDSEIPSAKGSFGNASRALEKQGTVGTGQEP